MKAEGEARVQHLTTAYLATGTSARYLHLLTRHLETPSPRRKEECRRVSMIPPDPTPTPSPLGKRTLTTDRSIKVRLAGAWWHGCVAYALNINGLVSCRSAMTWTRTWFHLGNTKFRDYRNFCEELVRSLLKMNAGGALSSHAS